MSNWFSVGTLWSSVANVRSGRRTVRPASRSPSNACGLVTSWTRCRSMYSSPGATSWAAQILSKRVGGRWGLLAAAQAGAHDGEQARRRVAGVLEVMGKVGVEGHGVPGVEDVALGVADQDDFPGLHDGGLAAAWLVHRRVAGAARAGARRERVPRQLGPLAGQ